MSLPPASSAEPAYELNRARVRDLALRGRTPGKKTRAGRALLSSVAPPSDSLASLDFAYPRAREAPLPRIEQHAIGPERRLLAILAADAADYSRLMGDNEIETLRMLVAHRALMGSLIPQHGGWVANMAGDSLLAAFPSALHAVQCALGIQERLEGNDVLPNGRRLRFRIGVHVGNVIVHDGDLFGDAVNLTARLQAFAKPGGLSLSARAYRQIRRVLPLPVEDQGPRQVKNIDAPVRVYSYKGWSDEPGPNSCSTAVQNTGRHDRLITAGAR